MGSNERSRPVKFPFLFSTSINHFPVGHARKEIFHVNVISQERTDLELNLGIELKRMTCRCTFGYFRSWSIFNRAFAKNILD